MEKKKNIVAVADDLIQSFDQLVDAAKRVVAADEKLQALETEGAKPEQPEPAKSRSDEV